MAVQAEITSSRKIIPVTLEKSTSDNDLIRSYLRDIGRVPLLSNDQEITLGRHVQELMALENLEKDWQSTHGQKPNLDELASAAGLTVGALKKKFRLGERAKERMVAANLRLVVSIAKKYTKRNMELLDLIQEGTIGLVRGVEKFDPARGYKFSTYAYWWIRQGITRAIAEKSRAIRLPIHITEMLNKLKKGQRDLSQQLSRTPSVAELAEYIDVSEEEVKDLMLKASQPVSLEMKVGDKDDTVLLDLLSTDNDSPQQQIELDCMKGDLEILLEKLPELQYRVLRMRYGIDGEEPMSLTGIGRVLGISRDRVRNLERSGLRGLRSKGEAVEAYVAS
ncbi:RpoD/SigA family RNA polymerase sigma factor [Prochlorococcus marinus]|uniref:Type II alternative RNA polymerase sigma factor, sigma-70 family n=1 Tax=Prochlorococcus marinus (strain MIT 9211) TaxID=93059 RepID=A9BD74_PROM4|nr:RpoD/SigA family RNA polymerase sigma factor [Prochlorococcus marinus]ABX09687.1 Type II alternative RNA polymerase sigma factor, sigma-70 family [Prochlorococcus marinus str. MIT 9211]